MPNRQPIDSTLSFRVKARELTTGSTVNDLLSATLVVSQAATKVLGLCPLIAAVSLGARQLRSLPVRQLGNAATNCRQPKRLSD